MMQSQKISRHAMNQLVMNFLMVEGHKDAAIAFEDEANIDIGDQGIMEFRDTLKNLIFSDQIDRAVELLKCHDENFFDGPNEDLLFELGVQKFISFLNRNEFLQATVWASENLRPLADGNKLRTNLLEKAMTLVAWDLDCLENFPYSEFREGARKAKVAGIVNEVLLKRNKISPEPKLTTLVKVMKWFQGMLASKNFSFPKMGDDNLGSISMEPRWEGNARFA
jgi:hypothetical protein